MKKLILLTFFLCSLALVFAQAGNSIDFDTADEHIRINNTDSFAGYNFSGDFTVEFWLNPAIVNEYTYIVSKWDTNSNRQWAVGKGMDGIVLKVSSDGTTENTAYGTSTLAVGTWTHVAAVRSGTSLRIYINGELNSNYSGPSSIQSSGTADLVIGGSLYDDSIQPARSVQDEIDEVRVWNAALSQATIQDYMNQTLTDGTHPNASNLQGYWKLNESTGSTASDDVATVNSGATAHNGTLVNCENDEWGTSNARIWYDVETIRWDGDATNADVSGGLTATCTNHANDADDFISFGHNLNGDFDLVTDDLPAAGTPGDGNADQRLNKVWSIEGISGKEGTLSFDLNSIAGVTGALGTTSDYFLLKKTNIGDAWTQKAATVAVNGQIVTFGSVGNYVDFGSGFYTIGAESDVTLPVEFATFNVALTSQKLVSVTWATHSETDMNEFNILRNDTDDPSTAVEIGDKPATNTSIYTQYQFEDQDVEDGRTYYYWIESVDHANNATLSDVQYITVKLPENPDEEEIEGAKEKYGLSNFPNPFNPTTKISFNLKEDAHNAKIEIYNILGQKIKTIDVGYIAAESNEGTLWHGTDDNGKAVSSGTYFFKLKTNSKTYIRKGTLLK